MSRVVPPPIEKNQNETGTTLSFLRSEAIHCTRKRLEKNAWPRNPTDSQRCSVVIMSVPSVSPRESTTCARWSAESALARARIPAVHLTGEPIGPQENFANAGHRQGARRRSLARTYGVCARARGERGAGVPRP